MLICIEMAFNCIVYWIGFAFCLITTAVAVFSITFSTMRLLTREYTTFEHRVAVRWCWTIESLFTFFSRVLLHFVFIFNLSLNGRSGAHGGRGSGYRVQVRAFGRLASGFVRQVIAWASDCSGTWLRVIRCSRFTILFERKIQFFLQNVRIELNIFFYFEVSSEPARSFYWKAHVRGRRANSLRLRATGQCGRKSSCCLFCILLRYYLIIRLLLK